MDDFQLQLREDPDAVFDWPEDEQERILQVLTDVQQGHQRLREMAADNAEYEEVKLLAILSSAIVDWEGLKTPCVKRNEIVEFDTLCTMKDELLSFTEAAGLEPKQAALAWRKSRETPHRLRRPARARRLRRPRRNCRLGHPQSRKLPRKPPKAPDRCRLGAAQHLLAMRSRHEPHGLSRWRFNAGPTRAAACRLQLNR